MKRWQIASWLLTVIAFGASWYVNEHRATLLPDQVPIHWGIDGRPDGFAARDNMFWYLMLPPLLMTGMGVLALLLPWLSPAPFALDSSARVYGYVMFLVVALFGLLHAVILAGYMVPDFEVARWLIVGCSLFIMLLGNVLGQVPRNFWIGIRTPWTLANNLVWVKTHRMGAWVMVADGFVCALLALLGVPLWLILIVLVGLMLVPVGYSLWLYKHLEKLGQLEPV